MKNNLFFSSKEQTEDSDNFFQEKQVEKLAEIGAQLRESREQKSMGLEKLAIMTAIRSHLLQAIEEGKLEELPEPIYIQRLLEQYANAVGLDGNQLAKSFPMKSAPEPIKKYRIYLPLLKLRSHHLYIFYIFVIFLSLNLLPKVAQFSDSPQKINSDRESIANTESPKNQPGAPSEGSRLIAQYSNPISIDSQQQSGSNSLGDSSNFQIENKPVMVSVIVKDDSWVSIEIDGKTEFEGILTEGTKWTWEAQKQLVVLAGNAGGVLVAFNNGEATKLGEPGAVEEVIFTANDLGSSGVGEVRN